MNKKNLKNHKTDIFNVFITEYLTKQRQNIVTHLNKAGFDHDIYSFWSNDGRIFYKTEPESQNIYIKELSDMHMYVPDPESVLEPESDSDP